MCIFTAIVLTEWYQAADVNELLEYRVKVAALHRQTQATAAATGAHQTWSAAAFAPAPPGVRASIATATVVLRGSPAQATEALRSSALS
ncbi:hypothetical protein AK812_SmicGene8295 [Symbiodinium microadriaticum]|uniref:Uncharacterized protein n=1 Tax=Symbiodinium microadriaticum TaxID=2951 RepID=A0A1Q9EL99_SYMMI|nr:hypothetical protein AK812_SmicGene8295 [Symbiodinium microadriaticum]